jgi:hypothetical protein
MASAQKELSTALRGLSDSQGGVVAQVERANNRLEYSLESRARTFDALLHEWKSDLLRIWIPLIAGAAMLIGLFGGMEIQGCRDAAPTAAVTTPTVVQSAPVVNPDESRVPDSNSGKLHSRKQAVKPGGEHER